MCREFWYSQNDLNDSLEWRHGVSVAILPTDVKDCWYLCAGTTQMNMDILIVYWLHFHYYWSKLVHVCKRSPCCVLLRVNEITHNYICVNELCELTKRCYRDLAKNKGNKSNTHTVVPKCTIRYQLPGSFVWWFVLATRQHLNKRLPI